MIVRVSSWGTAKVMLRKGKVAKSLTVLHEVPVLVDECGIDKAPAVARRQGRDAHYDTMVRIRNGTLLAPVFDTGRILSAADLKNPGVVGPKGLLSVNPPPHERPTSLNQDAFREIVDSGLQEASLKAARHASSFALIDGLLHRETTLPFWTVSVHAEATPRIELSQCDRLPDEAVRAVRFALIDGDAARAAAFACHEKMQDAALLLPPRRHAIELLMPEASGQSRDAVRDADARRAALAVCRYPSFAVLPPDVMADWIALRGLCESKEAGVADRILAGLRALGASFTDGSARKVFAAAAIGGQIRDVVSLFDCAWGVVADAG